jgi:hypothetical protein
MNAESAVTAVAKVRNNESRLTLKSAILGTGKGIAGSRLVSTALFTP